MKEFFFEVADKEKNLFYKLYVHKIGPFRFNWHKEIEINIVLKGGMEVCVEGKKIFLQQDDCIIINSNCGHATLAKEPDSVSMVLHLDPIYFKKYFGDFENLIFNEDTASGDRIGRLTGLKYLLASLLLELKKPSAGHKLIKETIFSLVVVNILKAFPPTLEKSDKARESQHQREVIAKALTYIEGMYKEKITLNKVAEILGYNPSYVSQFFKTYIGINYYEYLTRVRIREATFELARTDRSISEIALEYGFSDVKSFNKSFKENFMRSPNQYRAEVRQSSPERVNFFDRIFVDINDEYINSKLEEYTGLIQDNLLFMGTGVRKLKESQTEDNDEVRYKERIEELEQTVSSLNDKITLIRSILL